MLNLATLLLLAALATADCPPGSIYESYFNKCYQFVSTPKSFLDAEVYCSSLGGHLAEESNAFENSYIAGIASGASSKTPNFWIGANLLRSSSWTWTSNSSMGYTNWALGQPNSANACAYVKDSDLTWVTLSCNTPLPFMCTISPNSAQPGFCPTQPPPPTCAPSGCPSDSICTNGYTLFSGNCMCYKYYRNYVYFWEARATCTNDGGMLAKIPSEEVNNFLTALPGIQTSGLDCPFFGLSSNSITGYSWVDGTPLGNYTNFRNIYSAVATPRNDEDGKWEWTNNADSRSFLCQKASDRVPRLNKAERKQSVISGTPLLSQQKTGLWAHVNKP